MTTNLTIGERVAWYRRRRGMSQDVLAGLVGRTVDWLGKAENNRLELDRLSVIKSLADALDVALGDLLAEPTLMGWTAHSGTRTVPALRSALMNYRQLAPLLGVTVEGEPTPLDELRTPSPKSGMPTKTRGTGSPPGVCPSCLPTRSLVSRRTTGGIVSMRTS
ncbi:helix-turn-helix domain-containing protein [Streptomyces sp. NPDC059010]|uniref:helix-turn-helix domain-containing protein n=1 Tax=Streptomyces sp. NPDC059010 TaxID=3346695 RepID=UPI0036C18BC3